MTFIKESARIIDMVDAKIRNLQKIRLVYENGRTIVADQESQKLWQDFAQNPLGRLEALEWMKGKIREAQSANRKEPFNAIINDLPYVMVLVFGVNSSRSCIFHIQENAYVRVAKGPHWHPRGDSFPLENISLPVKHLLQGNKTYVFIADPKENPETKDLSQLIEMADIKSMVYCLILQKWVLIVDTTGEKESLSKAEESFLHLISEQLEEVILEEEKIKIIQENHKAEQEELARNTQKESFRFMEGIFHHEILTHLANLGGFSLRLVKKLKELEVKDEQAEHYLKIIEESVRKIDGFFKEIRNEIEDYSVAVGSLARLQRLQIKNISLSELTLGAITMFREKKIPGKKINSFVSCDICKDIVRGDAGTIQTAIYRIIKRIFTFADSLDIFLEVCESQVVLIFYVSDFNPGVNDLSSLSSLDKIKVDIEDLRLIISLAFLRQQSLEIWQEGNLFGITFERVLAKKQSKS